MSEFLAGEILRFVAFQQGMHQIRISCGAGGMVDSNEGTRLAAATWSPEHRQG